jgi:hypothetical protein
MSSRYDPFQGRDPRIIRFSIDGKWSVEDTGQFCLDLDDLYMLLESLNTTMYRSPEGPRGKYKRPLRDISKWLKSCNPGADFFRIIEIRYGSAGIQDVAGVGVIVGHLKDFILTIIENVTSRKSRSLKIREAEIENARRYLELRKDYNLTDEEALFLIEEINVRQLNIKRLIREGKLVSAKDIGELPPGK